MEIDRKNSRARFSASGRLTPEQATELAVSALAGACAEALCGMLFDFSGLTLSRSMSVAECYTFGERLAQAGGDISKVAFVMREDCLGPHQFAFAVARNRGLQVATFRSEAEAAGWLRV